MINSSNPWLPDSSIPSKQNWMKIWWKKSQRVPKMSQLLLSNWPVIRDCSFDKLRQRVAKPKLGLCRRCCHVRKVCHLSKRVQMDRYPSHRKRRLVVRLNDRIHKGLVFCYRCLRFLIQWVEVVLLYHQEIPVSWYISARHSRNLDVGVNILVSHYHRFPLERLTKSVDRPSSASFWLLLVYFRRRSKPTESLRLFWGCRWICFCFYRCSWS